jgi:hypothetical protein
MSSDRSLFENEVKRGVEHLSSGFTNFVEWQQRMVREFGSEIKPHLLKIWAQAREINKNQELNSKAVMENDKLKRYDELDKKLTDPEKSVNDDKQYENTELEKKLLKKNRRIELILFVGGAFLFIVNLTGGYYSRGGSDIFNGYSSSSGFRLWAIFGMAIGISMIVYGFLRRSWNKQKNG